MQVERWVTRNQTVSEKYASGKENVKGEGPEMRTGWTSPGKRNRESVAVGRRQRTKSEMWASAGCL